MTTEIWCNIWCFWS